MSDDVRDGPHAVLPGACSMCGKFACVDQEHAQIKLKVVHVFDSEKNAMACGRAEPTPHFNYRKDSDIHSHAGSFKNVQGVLISCPGCKKAYDEWAVEWSEGRGADPRSGDDRRAPSVEKFPVGSYVRVAKQDPEADIPLYRGFKGKTWNSYVDWTFRVNKVDEDDSHYLFCTPTAGTNEANMKCNKFRLPVSILYPAVGVVESAPVKEPLGPMLPIAGIPVSSEKPDMVVHPKHYGGDGVHEVWNCLDAWQQGRLIKDAHLWQAVKYVARAGAKGDELEDLKKARVYLDRAIARREKKS